MVTVNYSGQLVMMNATPYMHLPSNFPFYFTMHLYAANLILSIAAGWPDLLGLSCSAITLLTSSSFSPPLPFLAALVQLDYYAVIENCISFPILKER